MCIIEMVNGLNTSEMVRGAERTIHVYYIIVFSVERYFL